MDKLRRVAIAASGLAASLAVGAASAAVYSTASFDPADLTGTVTAFRADLGALNPPVPGSVGSGRREINWDGVPDSLAAPNLLPGDFFNVNSPRGVVFSTSGSGFQVSARDGNPTGTPKNFANLDPAYADMFEAFSPQRLFTALGSNVTDVSFFLPGSATPALTRGFGVVFSDVDITGSTTLSFYDAQGALLGTYAAPGILGDKSFSFVGATFDNPVVARVRIMSGSTALGTPLTEGVDVVAMDDFIYGEPVPEPGVWGMMIGGLALCATLRLRIRRYA
jgi:hypothetical protein